MPLVVLIFLGEHPFLNLLLDVTSIEADVLLHFLLGLLIERLDLADLLRIEDVLVAYLLQEPNQTLFIVVIL